MNFLERARDSVAHSHPAQVEVSGNLGVALAFRFQQMGRGEDLDAAIDFIRQAVRSSPQDHPGRPGYLSNLGNALSSRFERIGHLEDLHEAIDLAHQAVHATPQSHPDRHIYIATLGVVLQRRFDRTGQLKDLDEVIDLVRQAVRATPPDHANYPMYLSNLGVALRSRFEHTGQLADLDEAIAMGHQAVVSTPPDHPDHLGYLSNLGVAFIRRYESAGQINNLDEAIEVIRHAVNIAPRDNPNRPVCLSNLGIALRARFEHTCQGEDLDEAIEVSRQALDTIPQDHPDRPRYLSGLGTTLETRFGNTGQLAHLDEAIEVSRQAVAATPQDHPNQSAYLSNLGFILRTRFERTGQLANLDEAIEVSRRAVATTPQNHPNYSSVYLPVLGAALLRRFEFTGQSTDLDEAIEVGRQAVTITPQGQLMYPPILGSALLRRFERTEQMNDLSEAVEVGRQAVALISQDHPNRAGYLSNLGLILRTRFEHTGQSADLEEAIEVGRQAVATTPKSQPKRHMYLSNLQLALRSQFERSGQLADLDKAIEVGRQAAHAAPPHHPNQPIFLTDLGTTLRVRFERTGQAEDLDEAVAVFREAAQVASAPVHDRMQAAREWGRSAVLGQRWAEAMDGYSAAIDMAGLVVSRDLGRADQEHRLRLLAGLGTEAAAVCLQADQPGRAVEAFEHGRAVLFSQVLETRSDLTDLHQAHPQLAERFAHWRDELDRPGPRLPGLSTEFSTAEDASGIAARMETERRREAATELTRVLEKIQARPGFERFLKPHRAKELLPAAAAGPVVLLNVAELRSDALILTSEGIKVLPLKEIDPQWASEQLTVFLDALDTVHHSSKAPRTAAEAALAKVLTSMGKRVTAPVLDCLGYTTTPGKDQMWPRVWWCPSGPLSLFPLHAAGHHQLPEGPPNAVIDRVISSTTPTVRALLQARHTLPPAERRVLAVAMPYTPNQDELPGATMEVETLRQLFGESVSVLGLPGTGQATHDTVLVALPQHPLVHFCCHGESDLTNPSASHLLLTDYQARPLTVLDLTTAHLHGELAFLSACTTARTGITLPDEPIHLAAACQLAGYRHVIASLWPINDTDTAALTEAFYTTYAKTFPDTGVVATALHQATRNLRSVHRTRPSRWAPYTHTGP
ncbi:CHAT domain-containing protein [Kocuria sp. NPDC057446]|uniref:CHAT domain-containing protein n=1 Tax=Kocuria sp. NPDC057446 TaxID=3346137 RepID=UPI0036C7159E